MNEKWITSEKWIIDYWNKVLNPKYQKRFELLRQKFRKKRINLNMEFYTNLFKQHKKLKRVFIIII